MAPKETVWPRGPHTEGKHLVLRKYLNAWFPILGSWNGRILFIDGFAGPGEYLGGEDGSPIIALKALIEHSGKHVITGDVVFLFIEANEERAEHLESLVADLRPDLPENANATVIAGPFDNSMQEVLDYLDEQGKRMAPAFVMIDPFGISDTPMEVISRILQNPRCEVYVSFMYESMNRFLSTTEFPEHLDSLFGTDEWRRALPLSGDERRVFLYDLYGRQLKDAGAGQVVHFDLFRDGRLIYAIFFGTNHLTGCDRMKEAIWKVAPFGDYTFKGSSDTQLMLEVDQPNFGPLEDALLEEFGGGDWVSIEDVINFVKSDRTDYYSGQLKTPVLKPMETKGLISVDEETRRKRGTYPKKTRLKFEP